MGQELLEHATINPDVFILSSNNSQIGKTYN